MWALWLLGCAPPPADCPTWEGLAEPFLTTWCTPCHATTVSPADRRGAPVGMDFDTHAAAAVWAEAIAEAVASERMPPAGGVDPLQREALSAWVACGAEGFDPAPAACDDPLPVPTFAGCDGGSVAVEGSLEVGAEPAVDCVCRVDGDLVIRDGTRLSAAQLTHIGGTLWVEGVAHLALPEVRTVGGAVRLTHAPLVTADLHRLQAASLVRIQGGTLPATWGLTGLVHTHALHLEAVSGLEVLQLSRLESVGGDLRVADLPALRALQHTADLDTIGGHLVLDDLPALEAVADFAHLTAISGDLILRDLPRTAQIRAFHRLASIGGDLEVRSVDATSVLEGFERLTTIGGSLRLVDNLALADLSHLTAIERIEGDLEIRRNPALPASQIDGLLASLGRDGIGGTVIVEGNQP